MDKRKIDLLYIIAPIVLLIIFTKAYISKLDKVDAKLAGLLEEVELKTNWIEDIERTISEEDILPKIYTSTIYDVNGDKLIDLQSEQKREYIEIKHMPELLLQAFISVEDKRFYEHKGIDPVGIIRAIVTNAKSGGLTEGASTITQQVIKNNYLTPEKTFERKVKEQVLALRVEEAVPKDKILEVYLNTIAMGHNVHGVATASKYYYNKRPKDLTLSEMATLAATTKHPSKLSPLEYPEDNWERSKIVLGLMKEQGYINDIEYSNALADAPYARIADKKGSITYPYYVDLIIEQASEDLAKILGISEDNAIHELYNKGYKIYSSIDPNAQEIIDKHLGDTSTLPITHYTVMQTIRNKDTGTVDNYEHFVRSNRNYETQLEIELAKNRPNANIEETTTEIPQPQAAFYLINNDTGLINGLSGGVGVKTGNRTFNRAVDAVRQPGSTIKTLAAFAPALEYANKTPNSRVTDSYIAYPDPIPSKPDYVPKNWHQSRYGYQGSVTYKQALSMSMNICSIKVMMEVGPSRAIDMLEQFGITTMVRNGKSHDNGPALALGGLTNGISLAELTNAYATIANKGTRVNPRAYTHLEDIEGKTLIDNRNARLKGKRIISPRTAYGLTDMLTGVLETPYPKGTGQRARFSNYGIRQAGKTGTTTDSKDLWFIGFTPYYTAGIWEGYDQPRQLTDSREHLNIYREIMNELHKGLDNADFVLPEEEEIEYIEWEDDTEEDELEAIDDLLDPEEGGSLDNDEDTEDMEVNTEDNEDNAIDNNENDGESGKTEDNEGEDNTTQIEKPPLFDKEPETGFEP